MDSEIQNIINDNNKSELFDIYMKILRELYSRNNLLLFILRNEKNVKFNLFYHCNHEVIESFNILFLFLKKYNRMLNEIYNAK